MSAMTQFELREAQMRYAVPLIKDLQAILGEDVINDALKERLARKLEETTPAAEADMSRMAKGVEHFAAGEALQYEIIASDADHFAMDVTSCKYAQMMDELGGRAFGHLLLCGEDFAAAKQLGMTLERAQTRMQGHSHCDFRYRKGR